MNSLLMVLGEYLFTSTQEFITLNDQNQDYKKKFLRNEKLIQMLPFVKKKITFIYNLLAVNNLKLIIIFLIQLASFIND